MTPRLAVENLRVRREKNGTSFSLCVPRLEVFPGQTLAVLGSSGCGKSTLLDVLALILRPDGADTFLFHPGTAEERDALSASPEIQADIRGRDIGYVLQNGGLLSFLSVRDNILLPGRLLGFGADRLCRNLERLADRLSINDQLNKKPQHLSGGQRQRVAIARALIHEPRLILADEPTAAVDRGTAEDICAVFQTIALETGTSLIMVSHDAELMRRFAACSVTFDVRRDGQSIRSTLVEKNEEFRP